MAQSLLLRLLLVVLVAADAAAAATAGLSTLSSRRWDDDPPPNKTLFIHNATIDRLSGSIALRLARPAQAAQPALIADKPWESFGLLAYNSVVKAGPRDYRMYYDTGWTIPDHTDFHRFTCLATSVDGISWEKPILNISNFLGSTANNIVWPLDWRDNTHAAGTVFVDTNPAAAPDAKWKMLAQWNVDGANATSLDRAGVYLFKSADGVRFTPMFQRFSLKWSDTKNVMWWDATEQAYAVYIREDETEPQPSHTCTNGGDLVSRRVGRCMIETEHLHDFALDGCSWYGDGGVDTQCAQPMVQGGTRGCEFWGASYHPLKCVLGKCKQIAACGQSTCNAEGFCVVETGEYAGPLCEGTAANGTQLVLSFDNADDPCQDVYTNSATPYEDGTAVLLFPSMYQHLRFGEGSDYAAAGHNDGLLDIRFAAQHRAGDPKALYSSAQNGRSSFVPLGVNRCQSLQASVGQPQFNWCQHQPWANTNAAPNMGTSYMATGYVLSADGAEVSLFSGGSAQTHGGWGSSRSHSVGLIPFTGQILRHALRRDGFVFVEAGYDGATSARSSWPYLLTKPLAIPDSSACASGAVALRVNIETGVGGAAFFELSMDGLPLAGFGLNDSIMIKGNWISARVGWLGTAASNESTNRTTGLTGFSNRSVQVKVAMRDARLFSLSVGCERVPTSTRCLGAGDSSCSMWFGAEYNTVPCEHDSECAVFGPCNPASTVGGEVLPKCDAASKLCVMARGNRTICGRYTK